MNLEDLRKNNDEIAKQLEQEIEKMKANNVPAPVVSALQLTMDMTKNFDSAMYGLFSIQGKLGEINSEIEKTFDKIFEDTRKQNEQKGEKEND